MFLIFNNKINKISENNSNKKNLVIFHKLKDLRNLLKV